MNRLAPSLDEETLSRLLRELALEARGRRFDVAPNPCVGAAVLSEGQVIGRGVHTVFGGPHAEVIALEAAAQSGVPRERWDTLVVTLEPCSTEGKTPPCVDAIVEAGVRNVVIGAVDPDARHRGRGIDALREKGIEVYFVGGSSLEEVAPYFLRWTSSDRLAAHRPWTIVKWAQTLSGHLRPPASIGDGRWVSGPESLAEVQDLRAQVDAIITGVGTVLADDPRLTLRGVAARHTVRAPERVVLDSSLRTPPEARLFEQPGEGELAGGVHLLALAGADGGRTRALQEVGASVHGLRGTSRTTLELRGVMRWLWDAGARRVLVEAGPTLVRALFEERLVDQVRVVTGNIRGGEGESLATTLSELQAKDRIDRECGEDQVLEAFI